MMHCCIWVHRLRPLHILPTQFQSCEILLLSGILNSLVMEKNKVYGLFHSCSCCVDALRIDGLNEKGISVCPGLYRHCRHHVFCPIIVVATNSIGTDSEAWEMLPQPSALASKPESAESIGLWNI